MINKTDLAEAVGADLSVMERDALRMRDSGPFVFAQVCLALNMKLPKTFDQVCKSDHLLITTLNFTCYRSSTALE